MDKPDKLLCNTPYISHKISYLDLIQNEYILTFELERQYDVHPRGISKVLSYK